MVLWLWGRRKVNCVLGFQLEPVSAQILDSENVSTRLWILLLAGNGYRWSDIGSYILYIGYRSLVKLLGRFVNAHGSPVIPPAMTSVLRRGEQGHVHVFLMFSYCGFDFDWFLLFFSSPVTLDLQQHSAAPGRPGGFRGHPLQPVWDVDIFPLLLSPFTSSSKSCISF